MPFSRHPRKSRVEYEIRIIDLIFRGTLVKLTEVMSSCEDEIGCDEYPRPIRFDLLVEEHSYTVERKLFGLFRSDGCGPIVMVLTLVVIFVLFLYTLLEGIENGTILDEWICIEDEFDIDAVFIVMDGITHREFLQVL